MKGRCPVSRRHATAPSPHQLCGTDLAREHIFPTLRLSCSWYFVMLIWDASEHRPNAGKYFPGLMFHNVYECQRGSARKGRDLVQLLEGESCVKCIHPQSDSLDSHFEAASARDMGFCSPTWGTARMFNN